jgi:hypothetical protein
MNKEKVLGIIRHTLTFIGGLLVMKGLIGESIVDGVVGSVITLVGTIWSVINKSN